MPTFADSKVVKPSSWDEFEKIVCSAAKIRWDSPDFTRHGRQGQAQHGVDVYGRDKSGAMVGLQCKNTIEGVSNSTISLEVAQADKFKPTLAKLYIATTADPDVNTQAFARELSEARRAEGKFEVIILFWADIWDELTRDEARLFQHFPQLKPGTVETVSASVGPTHDQLLFERFKEDLAFDPSIRLLRDQDFVGAFKRSLIQPFFRFVSVWDTPEREFIDPELNDAFKRFFGEAQVMASLISQRISPIGSGDVFSVYPDGLRGRSSPSAKFTQDGKEINAAATEFVPRYEEFIRLCRTKLSV